MKIKNFEKLAVTNERKTVLAIAEAGLEAIDTEKIVKKSVFVSDTSLVIKGEKIPLKAIKRIFVAGVGKCSLEAGVALESVLGGRLSGGIVVDVHEGSLKKIKAYQGTHPLPTEINMKATEEIISLLEACNEHDFVIFVISGGGSTLLCQPTNFVCEEEAAMFTCLSGAGATIEEINTVRKHISRARGGYLAKYAYPAPSVALIFSDVPGDDLEFVASGPTVKDTTTSRDVERIIKKYNVIRRCGFPRNAVIETPKDEKYFRKVRNILFVSNRTALDAMAKKARELGFLPRIVTASLKGEAREIGKVIMNELSRRPAKTVLLYGGETTVTVRNPSGRGGRNQELALSALRFLRAGQVVASVASDGRDNGEFGGAICDTITSVKANALDLLPQKYLDENLSHEFFTRTGDYLDLGDTGSNVSDLIIAFNG